MSSVRRTQVSGDNEMRHIVRNTGRPTRLPARNHAESAINEASTATPSSNGAECALTPSNAPVSTSVGSAGKGRPACAARTLTKTNVSPYCVMSAIR